MIAQESNGEKLFFIYGSDGLEGFYTNEIDNQKNLQGDITHVYNSSGVLEAEYRYDAWGNHEVINHSSMLIGDVNPFRYRSYYFDVETGLYYLNSRYYDPEVGRFISADDVSYLDPESINGLNLYAYCGNNPVMNIDPNGNKWWSVLGTILLDIGLIALTIATGGATAPLLIGAICGQIYGGVTAYQNGLDVWNGMFTGALLGCCRRSNYAWLDSSNRGINVGRGKIYWGHGSICVIWKII